MNQTHCKLSRKQSLLVSLFVLPSLLLGCSTEKKTDRPETVKVQGVVLLDGAPVEGASITFQADGQQNSAVGRTDQAGKYFLTTFEPGDGAVAGNYNISIVKYEDPGKPKTGTTLPVVNLLPEKYSKPKTSGLSVTVPESGPFTHDLQLSK